MVFPALVFVECGKVDWEVGGLRRSGAWVTQWSRFLAFWCDGSHVAFEVNLTFHGDTHIINAYINIYILYMYIQIFRCRYKYIYIYIARSLKEDIDGMSLNDGDLDGELLSPNSLDDPALRAGTTDGTLVSSTPVVEDVAPPENVAVVPVKPVSLPAGATVNSMTHPDAWAWLNRSAKSGKAILPAEVLEEWNSGGSRRSSLLRSFVSRVYMPGASQQTNMLRLEAWNRIRQVTKDFTKTFKGYAWHTDEEMKEVLKWSETLGTF